MWPRLVSLSGHNVMLIYRLFDAKIAARRGRRGVSLFAVVLGLFVVVMGMDLTLSQLARQQKRSMGQELANIASILANRLERVIHTCAVDASQSATACSSFASLAVTDWNVLNAGPANGGRAVNVISSALRLSGTEPATWVGATPIVVSRDVTADLYIASVSQSPVATGLIVFRPTSDLDPLTLAAFREGLEGWNEAVSSRDEISSAEAVCASIVGCAIDESDFAVLTYPFVTIESEWLLREPWAGRSFAHEMQTEISSVVDPATAVPRPLSIFDIDEVFMPSSDLTVARGYFDNATFQTGEVLGNNIIFPPVSSGIATSIEAANVTVTGPAVFSDSLTSEIATVSGGVSASFVTVDPRNQSTEDATGGTIFANSFSNEGYRVYSAETFVPSGPVATLYMRVSGSTTSNTSDVSIASVDSSAQASSLYSRWLELNELQTERCKGC